MDLGGPGGRGDKLSERIGGHLGRLRLGGGLFVNLGVVFDRRFGRGRQIRLLSHDRRVGARQVDRGDIGVGGEIACKARFRQKQNGGGSHADGSHAGSVQDRKSVV